MIKINDKHAFGRNDIDSIAFFSQCSNQDKKAKVITNLTILKAESYIFIFTSYAIISFHHKIISIHQLF